MAEIHARRIKYAQGKGNLGIGTKTPRVIPISNKWTFIKKQDKEGNISHY
jgi:hypothetical protein